MHENSPIPERLFAKTLALVAGLDASGAPPYGGTAVDTGKGKPEQNSRFENIITAVYKWSIFGSDPEKERTIHAEEDRLLAGLMNTAAEAREIFCSFYSRPGNKEKAARAFEMLEDPERTAEEKAAVIAETWAPETGMSDEDIIRRWRLSDAAPNPDSIGPTEVLIQLNALYTLPEPYRLPGEFRRTAEKVLQNPGRKVADYDHPVHLYEHDENHELINCLREMEEDLAFEKERNVLPAGYKLPVLLSVSVTHENLDSICGEWIIGKIKSLGLVHTRVLVLTEKTINTIKRQILHKDIGTYSVFGKYGVHFNALKYTQLLFERACGIRAGFKLDTDEGMRSRDLFKATGKTWLQTLCHELWGGTAIDWKGRKVELACNLGEYINEKDIARLGYEGSMRKPDVKAPENSLHGDILFNKGAAHGRATALYNRFDSLGDHISHTVVKGGGYGITNNGLRRGVPFTLSLVGRAEDQQFYFSGINRGIRGIFHPDLRIAHYKGAVASSEHKTAATRFIGDMYRLIIFQHLAEILDVKADIDPMPGVFAGGLARAQAFYHTLYKALRFFREGDNENGEYLLTEGLKELQELTAAIDAGEIRARLDIELNQWKEFIQAADSADSDKTAQLLEQFIE